MRAEKVKAEFFNLETHMGDFRESKFKMKADVVYEDLLLQISDDKRTVRIHARNIGNMWLEKKAVRIAAMNFEIVKGDEEPSVVSGSIRLEFGKDAEEWFRTIWG